MGEFVSVYSRGTGRKQRVPRSWLGRPWAAGFVLTPRQRAADKKAAPTETEKKEIPAVPEEEA